MSLSLAERDTIAIATQTMSTIGLIGTIGMFTFAFFRPRHFHTVTGKMLFAKSCTDLVDSITKLVGRQGPLSGTESVLCQAQGLLINYSNQASIFLDFCLGMIVCVIALSSSIKTITNRMEMYLIIAAFLWPIPFCLVMLFANPPFPMIADVSLWCWISSRHFNYQVGLWFGWLWCVFLFNIFAIMVVSRYLKSLLANKKKSDQKHYFIVQRMQIFLVAFMVTWTGSSLNRSIQFIVGQPIYALSLMQALCSPARGFWNLCAFLCCLYLTPKTPKESLALAKTVPETRKRSVSYYLTPKSKESNLSPKL
jgi:hypothetical protein